MTAQDSTYSDEMIASKNIWQSSKKCIKDRFTYLFNEEELSDFYFFVGENKRIKVPVHKLVLSAGSSVFSVMFNGSLKNESNIEYINDIDPSAFLSFLRFLYTDEPNLHMDNVIQVLYAAKKYQVVPLEDVCTEFLIKNLNSDNVCILISQVKLLGNQKLIESCLKQIDINYSKALQCIGFVDIDLETLTSILIRDSLTGSEISICRAVIRWAEAECIRQCKNASGKNMREVLGDAIFLIRFPLMTLQEFATDPVQSKILTDREVIELFQYFAITQTPRPNIKFSAVPRTVLCNSTYKQY